MARIQPLAPSEAPDLKEAFDNYRRSLGFVPNSMLIMQRRPKMVKALAALMAATFDPEGSVERGFKRLLAHVGSRIHGCRYCMAHTAGGALRLGVPEEKVAAVWEYQTSPLYSEAERVALDFAVAASSVPNAVDDALFATLRQHWSDDQIVEILGVISVFGLLNRWNDSLATPLEEEAAAVGERLLAPKGWSAGKHLA
ncbi:MAG: carboxymuconolactone decarboxylase family protein [Usitatibacter sp.]